MLLSDSVRRLDKDWKIGWWIVVILFLLSESICNIGNDCKFCLERLLILFLFK